MIIARGPIVLAAAIGARYIMSLSRREMLGATTSLAAGVPLAENQPETAHRLKIIVTGGHPGDPEYGCGGTIARYTDLGHEAVLLYLNKGEWPPRDAGLARVAEAKAACGILKARPLYAGQFNSQAVVDAAHYEAFRKILEAERPDVVFTHWPIDNHADHRAISILVYDAWLKLKKTFSLYYYEVSNGEDTVQFAPTHYVDITGTEPQKRRACYAHASQSPGKYYTLQDQVMRMCGSRAATNLPRRTSGTFRALTSRCQRRPRREIELGGTKKWARRTFLGQTAVSVPYDIVWQLNANDVRGHLPRRGRGTTMCIPGISVSTGARHGFIAGSFAPVSAITSIRKSAMIPPLI